jgi:hypothetical protein
MTHATASSTATASDTTLNHRTALLSACDGAKRKNAYSDAASSGSKMSRLVIIAL